jgi:hypothetical protein
MEDLNTCYYSPGTDKHSCCTHTHYCIFNNNRTELETQITSIENTLSQFKKIKEAAINGEVIYHKGLHDFYNITSTEYIGLDGKSHHKLDVGVSDRFVNALSNKIINLEYDLENLNLFRIDVLHGKIGGYGYAD